MYRRIYLRIYQAAKQAFHWQTLTPIGISGTSRMGAPSTEDPQLTSKVVFLVLKRVRFDESGCVALAALISSSSEDELIEDEPDASSLSESESGACCSLVPSGVWPGFLWSSFGVSICNSWRSAGVIGGARNRGWGRGCFAPLDCEVNGLQPVLMSTRMSLWRKRL